MFNLNKIMEGYRYPVVNRNGFNITKIQTYSFKFFK